MFVIPDISTVIVVVSGPGLLSGMSFTGGGSKDAPVAPSGYSGGS